MKQLLAAAALAALLAAPAVAAPAQGPDYVGVFEAVSGGTRTALERRPIRSKVRQKGLGFVGADINQQVAGERSPVRFAAGRQLAFVVRVASQDRDPMTTLQLFSMKVRKGNRELTSAKARWGSAGNAYDAQTVPFAAERHGERFFRIRPHALLPPGEYMLRTAPTSDGLNLATGGDGFLFGVD